MLRRKAVVLAVAGALGTPVAALAQNVQIYGKMYPQLASSKTSGATAVGTPASDLSTLTAAPSGLNHKARLSQDTSNSRFGVRGTEDLGAGLKVLFQIESRVSFDTGGRLLGSRDSFVGLSGGFGTVRLGLMDTVYKQYGDQGKFLGISSGNFVSNSNVLSRSAFVVDATRDAAMDFHLRQPNSFMYESPEFGGVQFGITYSPDEFRYSTLSGSGGPVSTASSTSKNAELVSAGVKYTGGPLYLAVGYEQHKDYFGGSLNTAVGSPVASLGTTVHSKDRAKRGTVMYELPSKTSLSFDVSELEFKETGGAAGRFESWKNRRFAAGVQQQFGNVTGAVSYIAANAGTCSLAGGGGCSTTGLDGKQLNVGAMLNMSKRTGVYAIYSRLNNGKSAAYANTNNFDPEVGADTTSAALGLTHSF